MAYWLKLIYNRDENITPSDWRKAFPYITDHHRRRGRRVIQRPHYEVGDEVVIYSIFDGVCPAIVRVTKEADYQPDRVERDGHRGDGKRWGWLTETKVVVTAHVDASPTLPQIDVAPRSVGEHDHIRLNSDQYAKAADQLKAPARGEHRRGPRPVPIEGRFVESFEQRFEARTRVAQREEQRLVTDYQRYLERNGRRVGRHRIPNPDGVGPLHEDLFEYDRRNLVEAKARVSRAAIRMAIGQLADYARFLDPPARRRAVLLPERPSDDYAELLRSQKIYAVWRSGRGFADNAGGRLT